jgi:FkbM family methyltransferase
VILQTREVGVGGVMLDLGASVGRTSVTRGLLGDVRAVYAAEPEPASYTALVQNVVAHGLRGIVLPDRVAVGAARGEVQLHQSRFLDGHRVLATPVTGAGHHVVQVACWPVDAWMPQVGCDPRAVTFVKVDVQGGEPEVLRGAGGLLARRQAAWQVAIAPALLAKAGRSMADLLGALEPHFTHFIDIGTPPAGRTRLQPAAGLADWLTYLGSGQPATDLLLLP